LGNVRGLIPELAGAATTYYDELTSLIDPLVLELCRRRIAQIAGVTSDPITPGGSSEVLGITADQLTDLASWRSSDSFDARQKACLEFAEYFCYSSVSVTDEHVANMSAYLTPQEILSLTSALWITDALHRTSNFLKLVRDPEGADAAHPDH
jgi:alkylhydroperoxidase family enzyme